MWSCVCVVGEVSPLAHQMSVAWSGFTHSLLQRSRPQRAQSATSRNSNNRAAPHRANSAGALAGGAHGAISAPCACRGRNRVWRRDLKHASQQKLAGIV